MTKKDISLRLASATGLSLTEAGEATNALFSILSDALAANDDVTVRGFATFHVAMTKAKVGRNISKGTNMTIPARRVIKLRLSKAFKSRLAR